MKISSFRGTPPKRVTTAAEGESLAVGVEVAVVMAENGVPVPVKETFKPCVAYAIKAAAKPFLALLTVK
jgi:hypothetical protein